MFTFRIEVTASVAYVCTSCMRWLALLYLVLQVWSRRLEKIVTGAGRAVDAVAAAAPKP